MNIQIADVYIVVLFAQNILKIIDRFTALFTKQFTIKVYIHIKTRDKKFLAVPITTATRNEH